MECNKDEAIRSKEIAEGKFLQHDLAGAKKFALKARQLFPELDGLPQLLAVLDVHILAQQDTNWYGILQVDPTADGATIRKQYRKLALLLHPDKNKAVGAEAAFKLISEAWGVLSDNSKRALHDTKRNVNDPQGAKFDPNTGPVPTSNGFCNFARSSTTAHPAQSPPHSQSQTPAKPPPQSRVRARARARASSKSLTFWTACAYCKMQYEYLRIYENQNLACPTCYKPFVAREVHVVGVNAWWPPPYQPNFGMDSGGGNAYMNGFSNVNPFPTANFPRGTFRKDGEAQMVQETLEKIKRDRVQAQREARKKEQREKEQKRKEEKAKEVQRAREAVAKMMARSKEISEPKVSPEQPDSLRHNSASKQTVGADRSSDKISPENHATTLKDQSDKNDGKEPKGSVVEGSDGIKSFLSDELGYSGQAGSRTSPWSSVQCKRNASNAFESDVESQMYVSSSKKIRADIQMQFGANAVHEFTGCINIGSITKDSAGFVDLSAVGTSKMDQKCDVKVIEIEEGKISNTRGIGVSSGEINVAKSVECCGQDTGIISNSVKESLRPLETSEVTNSKYVECNSQVDVSQPPTTRNVGVIDVPDPDFYDFDKDRQESHFTVGQVWAVYDDDDGMPRYYARINKVLSFKPFKVQMSWLEPRSPSQKMTTWMESGFSCSCGEFKLGKVTTSTCVNTFSHTIGFTKGCRGSIRIYPRKGDVWALYNGWNASMKIDDDRDYRMIEILTDFREEEGVNIAFLVKIEGFKTIFGRVDGHAQALISPKELFKFSHQVPAHRLTPDDVLGVPQGCWELDPASTPMELISEIFSK
eukprot:c28445_g1_i1 orf=194-2638(+)